jgi:lysozyme
MKISQSGIDLIKRFEGCKLKSYLCPAGVWTIGYGHTANVRKNQIITSEQASAMLMSDLLQFERAVNAMVAVPLKQGQFDALVSFAFNLGSGALAGSTLLRKLNSGDYKGAADEFPRWNKAGGKVLEGLSVRRRAERALFGGK